MAPHHGSAASSLSASSFAWEHDVANPLLQEMKNKIQNQTLK